MNNIPRPKPLRQVLWAVVAAATLTSAPVTLMAQSTVRSPQPAEPIGAIVGGLLGASVGIVGGAYTGYALACGANACKGDFGGVGASILGLLIGETLLFPLGVHIGNGSKGNLATDIGVSVGVAVGAIVLGGAAESDAFLTLGVAAQFGLTIWAERAAGARAAREVTLDARRFSNGRTGIGLAIRY